MKYCTKCMMPDTKPYLTFDAEGVCAACRAHERKNGCQAGIDWAMRACEFDELVEQARGRRAPFYDALVPVSGGKDSITQVHRLLGRDLRVLAVNVNYGIKTAVGRRNLAIISEMGAHLIEYTPDLSLHKQLIRIGFEDYGDPDLLSHTLLHGYPLRVALQFEIPLVVLGENSAVEYSGEVGDGGREMDRAWFDRYAANKGQGPVEISSSYGVPMDKLQVYDFPDEIVESDTQAVFLSYYFHWESEKHLRIAQEHGFESLSHPGEGTFRNYVGIDEKINRIHQYIKVLKFGYGRATDHACEDIRSGLLTREEGLTLVREHDLRDLSDSFVDDFCEHLGYTRNQFFDVIERWRNKDIWSRRSDGTWDIPGHLES